MVIENPNAVQINTKKCKKKGLIVTQIGWYSDNFSVKNDTTL
jgi:hypothetical protein